MDIQFGCDVYVCAVYIVSYISKAQKGMSQLLQRSNEEARAGNSSIKQYIRDIGNQILHAVEISAQETVYMVFHLPTRKSSREVILIMTQKFTYYSNNVSTPYGGTTVYRRIPYLPGQPYCHNIRSIEVTVIKITIYEDWTILGIYRSPKEPVRKLCPVISEI